MVEPVPDQIYPGVVWPDLAPPPELVAWYGRVPTLDDLAEWLRYEDQRERNRAPIKDRVRRILAANGRQTPPR